MRVFTTPHVPTAYRYSSYRPDLYKGTKVKCTRLTTDLVILFCNNSRVQLHKMNRYWCLIVLKSSNSICVNDIKGIKEILHSSPFTSIHVCPCLTSHRTVAVLQTICSVDVENIFNKMSIL